MATKRSTDAIRRWEKDECQPPWTALPALMDCYRCTFADIREPDDPTAA
jgi:hypothetical protein